MAEVKNVVLTVTNSANAGKKNVKVDYTLLFDPSEAGKQYQVAISLMGEDTPSDEEPPKPFVLPQPLYTFGFGLIPPQKYTVVTAQAGEQSFSETREVDTSVLNEDPGVNIIQTPSGNLKIPHPDEVYAAVNVSRVARSNTVNLFI
ncbi:hypothetical protein [Archangium lipolyticum]|uniref:hypothetical protein n=1 Tax=Archangium lipolyticum TaxID=2970465 RepID=UPI002149AB5F|nr:hypothetical protein [Archangium lipolyticum]